MFYGVSFLFRCGVVGNMSGFHPVASGSIPGSGSLWRGSKVVKCARLKEIRNVYFYQFIDSFGFAGSNPALSWFLFLCSTVG